MASPDTLRINRARLRRAAIEAFDKAKEDAEALEFPWDFKPGNQRRMDALSGVLVALGHRAGIKTQDLGPIIQTVFESDPDDAVAAYVVADFVIRSL